MNVWVEVLGLLAMVLIAPASFVVALVSICVLGVLRRLTAARARLGVWWATGSVLLFFGGCGAAAIGRDVIESFTRQSDLETVAENSKPLIAAIRDFEQAHEYPPESLERLVPEYLHEVPGTGLSWWPKYEYWHSVNREPGWTLDVWIPKMIFDLDGNRRFLYKPDASNDWAVGATLRRGDWVYIPD